MATRKADPFAAFDAAVASTGADPLAAFDAAVQQTAAPPPAPPVATAPAPATKVRTPGLDRQGITSDEWRRRMAAVDQLVKLRVARKAAGRNTALSQAEIDEITLEAQRDAAAGRTGAFEGELEGAKRIPAAIAEGAIDATVGTAGLVADVYRNLNALGSPDQKRRGLDDPLKYTEKADVLATGVGDRILKAQGADPLYDAEVLRAGVRMGTDIAIPIPGIGGGASKGARTVENVVKDAFGAPVAARVAEIAAKHVDDPVKAFDEAVKAVPVEPKAIAAPSDIPSFIPDRRVRAEARLVERRQAHAAEHGLPVDHPLVDRAARADVDLKTGAFSSNAFDEAKDSAAAATAVDLAHLGKLNDSPIGRELGDAFGDEILATMARAMDEAAAGAGKVYRRGGDEFAVLWDDAAVGEKAWPEVKKRLDETVVQFQKPDGSVVEWQGIDHYIAHGKDVDEASAAVNSQKPAKSDVATREQRFAEYWKRIESGSSLAGGKERLASQSAPAGGSGVRGSVAADPVAPEVARIADAPPAASPDAPKPETPKGKPLNLSQGLPLPTGRHTYPMTVESNAGVEAVRSLAGQKELDSLVAQPIDDLRRTLEQKGVRGLPDAKDPKYRGKSYEAKRDMIAAYGQQLARKAGHDEIVMTNPLKPDVNERVAISADEPEISGPPAKRADVVRSEAKQTGGGSGAPPRRPRRPRIGGSGGGGERRRLNDWFDAEAYANRMNAKREAARGTGAKQETLQVLREMKAKFIDSVSPIEDAVRGKKPPTPKQTAKDLLGTKALEGDVEAPFEGIKPSEDIRNAIDSAIMSGEKAGQFLRDNGFDKIVKGAKDVGHFEQFAAAKHAITLFYQRWAKQISRATPGRAKRLSAIYERRFGRDLFDDARMVKAFEAEYDDLATQLNQYSHKVLDYSVESGLIKPELAEHLKAIYPYYVPLKRVFSVLEETADEGVRGVASLSKQTVVRKLVGSQREIESPLTSMLEKTYDAFAQGERNKAAKMLVAQKDLPGNPLQLRELTGDQKAAHTISFLDNGRKRTFATTPEIAAAAKSLNVEQISMLGRILAVPARVLKVGATGLNVAFLAKNPVRDAATAIINSPQGREIAKEMGRAMWEAANHGELYDEILREGGMFTSFDQFRILKQETLASIRGERAIGESTVKYTVRRAAEMFRAVEDIVARGEQVARIAAYSAAKKKALAQGLSEAEARLAGKQAALWTTGPFHRQGEWGRVLRASAPYLNAGIQGQRVTVAALRTRPIPTFAKIAVTTTMPVAIATAWNLSDPKRKKAYDDIADFEKENSLIIVPPNPEKDEKGLWNVIKIPLPQGVAKWASLFRRPIEAGFDLDPVKTLEVAQLLLGTVSPVSSVNELGANVVPQAVKPALETSVNRNFFAQREIVPAHMQDRPAKAQVFRTTSGTARLLGKISGLSPLQIEHLIRGYTAGLGQQTVNGVDRVLAAIGVIPENQIGGEGPIDMTTRGFAKAIPTPPREKKDKARRRAGERGGG